MGRVGLLICVLLSGVARGDEPDRELARTRFKAGQALFQRGRVSDALAEFEEGKKSFPLPEFDYNIGLCLAKLGQPGEAADALQRYIDVRADDPDAAGIWKMIAELRAQTVRQHEDERRRKDEAARAAHSPIPEPMPLIAPVAPRRDTGERRRSLQTKLGIAAVSLGAAFLVASVATGVGALNNKSQYDSSCRQFQGCADHYWLSAHHLAGATDGMVTVGVALVVTSIVLFATRPKEPPRMAWGISF